MAECEYIYMQQNKMKKMSCNARFQLSSSFVPTENGKDHAPALSLT